jgi:hypothetical protein
MAVVAPTTIITTVPTNKVKTKKINKINKIKIRKQKQKQKHTRRKDTKGAPMTTRPSLLIVIFFLSSQP